MAYPRVNGNHIVGSDVADSPPSSAIVVSPPDTSPSSATEQNVPAEDPSIFPATSPEVDAHDPPNSAVAAPPPNTAIPSSTEQGVSANGQQTPLAAAVAGSEVSSHSPSHDAATSSSAASSPGAPRYMPPGVRRCVSNFSDRRINIYGIPRSAVRAASSYASSYNTGEGQGLDSTSSNRELLITLYGQARLPAWLRKLSPQGTHFIARKMVDSAFPIPKKRRYSENDDLPNECRVVNGLPRMLEGVADGYTSFKHFLLCEKHRLPIDLVYSIAHASAHNVNQSMGEVHDLSKSLITQAESLFQKWEGKVQSDAEELADEFDFKIFCGMAYNLWKCIIEKCPSYYLTSFPQAPDICGLHPPDFFKLLVPHFLHEETDCRMPITCLHHIFADLLEDAQRAFEGAVDISDADAVNTQIDLVADVVFCDERNLASPSTVLQHQTLFAIFRKIAFIIQTVGAWEFLFSYCSIVDDEVDMKKFVEDTDIDFTKLSVEKSLVIIASRFCVVLERPDLLKKCCAFFAHGADMRPRLNYAVILRHCIDSRYDACGVYERSVENPSLFDTIGAGTIYVRARLRVFLILSVSMALGTLYLWMSINSASDDRFGNYVSLILLLAGAVLGIGPGIMRRGWTYYDFVRWRMPIRETSELGSRAYITALTVAKTYGLRISGRYNGVFPDLYCSAGGSLIVDVPIRLDDAQQHNTIIYSTDYDGVLVVRLRDKMTRMYPNRVNFFSKEAIETDPLADDRQVWNLQQALNDGLIA